MVVSVVYSPEGSDAGVERARDEHVFLSFCSCEVIGSDLSECRGDGDGCGR